MSASKKLPNARSERAADVAPRKPKRGGVPPKEHAFKPGNCANPLGGGAHDPVGRAIRNLTKKELQDIANLVIKGDLKALRALPKKAGTTVLQIMLASVCIKIIEKGDMSSLNTLLDRLIGKVKDDVVVSGNTNARVLITLPDNGRSAKK